MFRSSKARLSKSIDAATATRLLAQYKPLLRAAHRRHPWLDHHELQAVWEDAVCEAYSRHDAGKSHESGWVQRVFYWRLTELIERESAPLVRSLGTDPKVLNGVSPAKAFLEASTMSEVLKLPPRQQTILIAWAHGYTYAEVAEQVGVSLAVCHREAMRGLEAIRRRFEIGDDKDRS